MDLVSELQRHSNAIERFLENEVPRETYPFLSEGVWYQFEGGGKRLRPALCLMACEALGGIPKNAVPFALATEILHNVLLIHDDIEDGDTMRRDRPTLWAHLGVPNAINVADFLLARAYDLVLRSEVGPEVALALGRQFAHTFERTVEGQALDINLRGDAEIDLATYYRIVRLKTGHYLALPWVGGALIAGVSEGDLEPFWELGRALGPAFQIRDDLIDLTEGKGRGGEVGCDLREGKPSICFAYVYDHQVGTAAERDRLRDVAAKPRDETSTADVAWAIEFYRTHGVLDFAQAEAERLIRTVDPILDRTPFDQDGKALFRSVSQFIVDRKT